MVMHGAENGPPPGLKPHIRVKLRPGWRYHPGADCFVSDRGDEVEFGDKLPAGSRVVAVAPELAKRRARSLTADEEVLARWLQVILPEGVDPEEVRALVERWDFVEETESAPSVGLPGGGEPPSSPGSPAGPGLA